MIIKLYDKGESTRSFIEIAHGDRGKADSAKQRRRHVTFSSALVKIKRNDVAPSDVNAQRDFPMRIFQIANKQAPREVIIKSGDDAGNSILATRLPSNSRNVPDARN
jgi:hypothetical protein